MLTIRDRARARLTAQILPSRIAGLAGILLVAAGLSTGCRDATADRPELAHVRVDLVEEMASADVRGIRARLRLADPAARRSLTRGFSFLEEDDSGPYVWALGNLSEVEILLARPTAFELVIHGWSFQPPGAPRQELELEVNGHSTGSIVIDEKKNVFRLPVAEEHTRAGVNRLGLRFARAIKPSEWLEGSHDSRPLSLKIYSFELEGLETAEPPVRRALADGEHVMELPPGSRASWFVEARPGDSLALEPVPEPGADELEIWARVRAADGRARERVFAADEGVRLDLDALVDPESLRAEPLQVELLVRRRLSLLDRLWGETPSETDARGRAVLRGGIGPRDGASAPDGGLEEEIAAAEEVVAPSEPAPDLLIYMIDTLRADRLGVYGSDLGLTPNLDRFAEDAVVFRQSRAQTSWTRTGVTSVITGLYPQSHGVNDRDDGLVESVQTLAEALHEGGYQNVGAITNGNVSARFGVAQGYHIYQHLRESRQRRDVHILSDEVTDWAATWLTTLGNDPAGRDRAEHPPFYLYLHVTDPHAPYTPHEPFRSRFAADARAELGLLETVRAIDNHERPAGAQEARELLALYNAEVAFTDHHFGRLIDHLKELGLYDSMAILVISDHGEEFLEHGEWEHGATLYEEQLRVPMILKLPDGKWGGQALDVRAGQVDVMPTLLEALGLEVPPGLDGRSLLPAIRGEDSEGGAVTLAYLALEGRDKRSLVVEDLKLISDAHSIDLLYDLAEDAGEKHNLAPVRTFDKGRLSQTLRGLEWRLASEGRSAEQVEIDPELRKQLEALGYLQ